MRNLEKFNTDEMPHYMALHQGLSFLQRRNRSAEKEIQFCLEIFTCDPYIMDRTKFSVSNKNWKYPSVHKG